MTISIRLNDEDTTMLKMYAQFKGMSVSETVRRAVFERIENEFDMKAYEEAMEEYKKNPITYTHEDVARMIEFE